MESLRNELENAEKILSRIEIPKDLTKENQNLSLENECLKQKIAKLSQELETWKRKNEGCEKEISVLRSENQVQKELISQNDKLAEKVAEITVHIDDLNKKHEGCDDKIAALRSVARALESENQLLTGEKENLERFKTQFCRENGTLK